MQELVIFYNFVIVSEVIRFVILCLSNHRIALFATTKNVQNINYCAESVAYYSQKLKEYEILN